LHGFSSETYKPQVSARSPPVGSGADEPRRPVRARPAADTDRQHQHVIHAHLWIGDLDGVIGGYLEVAPSGDGTCLT